MGGSTKFDLTLKTHRQIYIMSLTVTLTVHVTHIGLCGVAPMAPLHSVVFRSRIAVLNTRDRTMWDMCETVPVSAKMSPCVLLEP